MRQASVGFKINVVVLKGKIMVDKTEEVVWRTYPGIDFLQANQFGEIRTVDHYTTYKDGRRGLIKGHVLKQSLNKQTGYLQVSISINGKHITLNVHHVIATCFLPNPDNLPQVNHKDCDRTNNNIDNLEFCTLQYNNAYREKYGTPAKVYTKKQKKPLFAVNLKTLKVTYFESLGEAARQLGICKQNISKVIKGQYRTAGGYWFTKDESEITEEKIRKIKDGMRHCGEVIAIDLKTREVLHFNSRSEAVQQLKISVGNIGSVLKGRHKQAGGYWFTEDESKITEEKIQEIKDSVPKTVLAVNLKTKKISLFKSQREAARQLGVDHGSVSRVFKGRYSQTGGYWFCYADENTVEKKTRAKFGDEVASKVEKLINEL